MYWWIAQKVLPRLDTDRDGRCHRHSREHSKDQVAPCKEGALPKGATKLYITPLSALNPKPVPLTGHFPVKFNITPSLEVSVTGVEFHANETLVHLNMDAAKFKQETTYQGKDMMGQFWLEASDTYVGSESVIVDGNNPNKAVVVFGKVDPSKNWSLGASGFIPQSQLALTVPLK